MLFQLLVVSVEVTEFVREDVSVGHEVEVLLAELLLHPHHVEAESIFPGYLVALREVVDLLVLIEALIEVRFTIGSAPEDIPFM